MMAAQQQQDPYVSILAEIDRELQRITRLQARLFAGQSGVARELSTALRATEEQLSAVETAVQRMVAEPSTFNLEPAAAFGRQVEVETLRYTLNDLQRTCAHIETSSRGSPGDDSGSSSSRGAPAPLPTAAAAAAGSQGGVELATLKLPPPGSSASSQWHIRADGSTAASSKPGGGGGSSSSAPRLPPGPPIRHSKLVQSHGGASLGGAPGQQQRRPDSYGSSSRGGGDAGGGPRDVSAGGGDPAISYEAMMQQQIRREQDDALDHISISVDRIKQHGLLMHEELEEQAGLLSGLHEDVDSSHIRLRALQKKVAELLRKSRQDRQLCVILALSLVLVVLTVLAIA